MLIGNNVKQPTTCSSYTPEVSYTWNTTSYRSAKQTAGRSEGDVLAFQDGIDSNDGVFNGFFTGPINTWNETTKNGEMFTLKNAFTGVATSNGHATEIKTNFNPTGSTSTVSAQGSNFFYFSGSKLYFHKLTDSTTNVTTTVTTTASGATNVNNNTHNVYHYQNFTVAALSNITGVGTGANQIDASDIILF